MSSVGDGNPPRVVIVGAGALGSLIGARLALAQVPVQLIARGEHADVIRRDGLLLRRVSGDARIPIGVSERLEDHDAAGSIVFLTCKAHDVAELARRIAACWGKSVPVVCWQNGVQAETDAAASLERVYGGTTSSNANLLSPGVVVETRVLPFSVGLHPRGTDAFCAEVVRVLAAAGLSAGVEDDIASVKWSKIFGSVLGTFLTVVDRTPFDAEVRPFMIDLLEETLVCLRAAGITLRALPGQPAPEAWVAQLRAGAAAPPPPPASTSRDFQIRTSTWQDLALGRGRTETDYLNGAVVALAERMGGAAPLNRAIQRALTDMATRRLQPGAYTVADLRRDAR